MLSNEVRVVKRLFAITPAVARKPLVVWPDAVCHLKNGSVNQPVIASSSKSSSDCLGECKRWRLK
jgi:hypothetical protein